MSLQSFRGYPVFIVDGYWKPFAKLPKHITPKYAPRNWFTWKKHDDGEIHISNNAMYMTTRTWNALKELNNIEAKS